jgi:hypothetical protein
MHLPCLFPSQFPFFRRVSIVTLSGSLPLVTTHRLYCCCLRQVALYITPSRATRFQYKWRLRRSIICCDVDRYEKCNSLGRVSCDSFDPCRSRYRRTYTDASTSARGYHVGLARSDFQPRHVCNRLYDNVSQLARNGLTVATAMAT